MTKVSGGDADYFKDSVFEEKKLTIRARVLEAKKAAEVNAIPRRKEAAAQRSLFNTAKALEGTPVFLRMNRLETLERVAERINKISVFGGLGWERSDFVVARFT